MDPLVLVLSTFPDEAQARQTGTALIERHLAACVNFLPGVLSIYRWKEKIESDQEVLAIFKTRRSLLDAFESALTSLHPYETPEVVALEADRVADAYHRWMLRETGEDPAPH